jgi:hypothetical protein
MMRGCECRYERKQAVVQAEDAVMMQRKMLAQLKW